MRKIFIEISKSIFLVLTLLILTQSCNENKTIKYLKLNDNQTLKKGEWLSSSDSLAGISIRGRKIAFFKKMVFNSEDICEFSIIDSIHKNDNSEKKIGMFLLVVKNKDTTKYKILKRNEKLLVMENKNKTETYKFWR
ncbi:hypothetical protein FLSI110296_06490 [Flavobacterium sinopsychrotolerans]|uniref:Lipoprotein n=1 Tax=Flavobacterium sinopsychrotolerans TaxID=604089 RepID=A0A1H8RSR1_9FLAO|nr:hypothetical protein [Flavobacterium sinopsychrotolerans]SEO69659.1 hypothetical protein SAMN04487942_0165 [Flavobacterium sinopsychrotolerans]